MRDHDRLSNLVLNHWCLYSPSMLEELRQQNRLDESLEETAQQFADLMYELVSVKKLEYRQVELFTRGKGLS